MAGWTKWLWYHRNYFIIVLTPIVFLWLPLAFPSSEARGGYAIIIMALYWCTECMPLAMTAMLPVVLFPMMGIMTADKVSIEYLRDSNMLFIGGLLVAIAVENWNLHKRIALRVLLLVGVRPSLLMIGFMVVSSFLSMWISNTATTAMMLPIANAVLQQLKDTELQAEIQEDQSELEPHQVLELKSKHTKTGTTEKNLENGDAQSQDGASPDQWNSDSLELRKKALEDRYDRLTKGLSLCVCYSASIGGTATLTGTTPNLILQGQINSLFPQNGGVINFASWFGFAFPNMLLMLVLSYLWLQFMFLGFNLKHTFGCGSKSDRDKEGYKVMETEYKKLGPMKFAEIAVLTIFILLVVLWFTRAPGFIPGWANVLFTVDNITYVSDGTTAIFVSMLFFVIPSRLPKFGSYGYNDAGKKIKAPKTLLNWKVVHEKMPWNIILLLGGGYALAKGSEDSGLSEWLGNSLTPLQKIPPFAISILLSMLVALFTECSSNTATTTLFLPILASMAIAMKVHPLYVMLPCTIASSLAFMLPVATPPNAIAFSFGNLKVLDMVKAGCILNFVGILTVNLGINTWGDSMFGLSKFPHWANVTRP